jgi:hypothetical protein
MQILTIDILKNFQRRGQFKTSTLVSKKYKDELIELGNHLLRNILIEIQNSKKNRIEQVYFIRK